MYEIIGIMFRSNILELRDLDTDEVIYVIVNPEVNLGYFQIGDVYKNTNEEPICA